jgi:hypothetical protein
VSELRHYLGFSRKEIIARTHAVKANKTHYPVHTGTLGVNPVVMEAQILADLIEKFRLYWFLTERRVRHMHLLQSCRPDMADNGHREKVPESAANIILSGQMFKLINGCDEFMKILTHGGSLEEDRPTYSHSTNYQR